MKSFYLKAVAALVAVALISVSCKKEDNNPTPSPNPDPYGALYKIGSKTIAAENLELTLYMAEEAFMGYNHVYVVVKNTLTDEWVKDASVRFKPMMDMGTMQHTAPKEDPVWVAEDLAYRGTITFIMPTAQGTWTVGVEVTNPVTSNKEEVIFDVAVIDKPETRLISFVSSTDSSKVIVALADPRDPEVGMNDFHLVVYKKLSMMEFPPLTALDISIEPEMPTMGHGSPNNVNPTDQGNGHYMGQINFTMTGYWKVSMKIKDDQGQMLYDQGYFDITFQ